MSQIELWRDSGHSEGHSSGKWIDKVRWIRSNMGQASVSYERFWEVNERDHLIRTVCDVAIKPVEKHQLRVLRQLGLLPTNHV